MAGLVSVPVAIAAAWAILLGIGGGVLTTIGPWYYALRKPSFQPPDWLFGPAWTVIFALAGWAFVLGWNRAPDHRAALVAAYAMNGAFNVAWSVIFFQMRRPGWAFIETIPLWLSIAGMMAVLVPVVPVTFWMLLPYLAWVSFAACLTLAITRLNPRAHESGLPLRGARPARA